LVTTAIIGILGSIAVPKFHGYTERTMTARAAQEIRALEIDIATYHAGTDKLPLTLADIGRDDLKDPWGNVYQYLNMDGAKRGDMRKDRFLVPLNSDYDLYSNGPDGKSQAPLTSAAGRDDILRANDGGYVGPASKY
jgi:general secretion pathway protein G